MNINTMEQNKYKTEDMVADAIGTTLDVALGSIDVIGAAVDTVITVTSHIA